MNISTEIYHLQKLSQYGSEKPYTMRYVPDGHVPVSNVAREKHLVSVTDMRNDIGSYQLEKSGFTVVQLATEMAYEDYDSHEKITDIYLRELESELSKRFPASTVDLVSYFVRKREASFPYSTGDNYTFGQPNIVAHVDATSDDLMRQILRRHGDGSQKLLEGRCQYITIWKPLRGPLHDYPLALCDHRSLDFEKDLEPQDIVDRDEVLENAHVYFRPQHQWYYLSGQQATELLVFRQADTRERKLGTPHCAIFNPSAPENSLPRESIEVVAFIYTPD